jgi:hypothetical protein
MKKFAINFLTAVVFFFLGIQLSPYFNNIIPGLAPSNNDEISERMKAHIDEIDSRLNSSDEAKSPQEKTLNTENSKPELTTQTITTTLLTISSPKTTQQPDQIAKPIEQDHSTTALATVPPAPQTQPIEQAHSTPALATVPPAPQTQPIEQQMVNQAQHPEQTAQSAPVHQTQPIEQANSTPALATVPPAPQTQPIEQANSTPALATVPPAPQTQPIEQQMVHQAQHPEQTVQSAPVHQTPAPQVQPIEQQMVHQNDNSNKKN